MCGKMDKVYDELMKKMFEKWPDFDYMSKDAQEKWEKLEWTDKEYDDYKEWAIGHLKKRLRWNRKRSERALSMFLLKYAPRFKVEDK